MTRAVMLRALALVKKVCPAFTAVAIQNSGVAHVCEACIGDKVQPMSARFDRTRSFHQLPVTHCSRMVVDNYIVWALHNPGSAHTIMSVGACRKLSLEVLSSERAGS